jgi:sorbitol-6-phosphate 2-dehydrogenase
MGLTQSLARELVGHGIRVNAICPGHLLDSPLWTESLYDQYAVRDQTTPDTVRQRYLERIPMGRGCTYEDVCNAVVFLASDQSSYITGQSINVSGGEV